MICPYHVHTMKYNRSCTNHPSNRYIHSCLNRSAAQLVVMVQEVLPSIMRLTHSILMSLDQERLHALHDGLRALASVGDIVTMLTILLASPSLFRRSLASRRLCSALGRHKWTAIVGQSLGLRSRESSFFSRLSAAWRVAGCYSMSTSKLILHIVSLTQYCKGGVDA